MDRNIETNNINSIFNISPDEEMTIKIRTIDKEFELKIKKTDTIRKLKEKIEEVIKNNF